MPTINGDSVKHMDGYTIWIRRQDDKTQDGPRSPPPLIPELDLEPDFELDLGLDTSSDGSFNHFDGIVVPLSNTIALSR